MGLEQIVLHLWEMVNPISMPISQPLNERAIPPLLIYGRNSLTNTTYDEMLRANWLVIAGRLGHLKRKIDAHGLQKNPFCKLCCDWLIKLCSNGGVLFKKYTLKK